uniref:cellulase n=1 Tax=uncultured Armatimonadetes bacterium TaxID=157466 RepID=A0A6J4ILF1_9BACT|nr:GH5_5 / GH5 / GH5_25 / GH5_39 [uncultured Armatimonadetes bacterium]
MRRYERSGIKMRLLGAALALGLVGATVRAAPAAQTAPLKPLPYTGVNLAGGEFYDPNKVSEPLHGKNFTYPTAAEFDYFAGKGMNVFRVPFRWETLQPAAKQPFRKAEIDRLKACVKLGTDRGLVVILDPHNSARYFGKVVGGPEVGHDVFADFWARLSAEFKGDQKVWFGLVNEPHGMPTAQWVEAANAAIAAIRKAGARNRLLVPGNAWSGAHSWLADWYGGPNGVHLLDIRDPQNNYLIEVHQYLDPDSSGTRPEVVSPTIGSERIRAFTEWCRKHKKRAFLGEFAAAPGEAGQRAIDDLLRAMERDRDVWVGFTWWAAGAWWGDYMFSLEPKDGRDRPQMAYLRPHLQPSKTTGGGEARRRPASPAVTDRHTP